MMHYAPTFTYLLLTTASQLQFDSNSIEPKNHHEPRPGSTYKSSTMAKIRRCATSQETITSGQSHVNLKLLCERDRRLPSTVPLTRLSFNRT